MKNSKNVYNETLEKLIKKGDILTEEQLEKLGLENTGKICGMNISTTEIIKLPIYEKDGVEYILKPLNGKYQVFAERNKLF